MKIINKTEGAIGSYAEAELKKHIEAVCGNLPDITFILQLAPTMEDYAYGYNGSVPGQVLLLGKRENEVLLAVYLALEAMGYIFDTKTRAPKELDFTCLQGKMKTVKPFVRLRGIRQHINFPMDISSYHLEDAQEYIRSLARMRMNAITFHSYDGMWHNRPGHFFYGKIHNLPEKEAFRKIVHNRNYYMIPECEALYGQEDKVADFAVYWLNELMKTAKECGLHVTMSIEPAKNVAVTLEMLSQYPHIDMLELISPEGGGPCEPPHTETEEIKAHAVELFGEKVLDEKGNLPGLDESKKEHSSAIYATMDSLKLAMDHIPQVKNVPVRVGLYVLCAETLYIVKRIMDKVLPSDMIQTYLPAHGAEMVNHITKGMEFRPVDFQKTVLHSWIEFDGNMYISQNAANAIGRTVEWLKDFTGAPSIHALYFNHWRTEENRLSIAYGAAATECPVDAKEWYISYAQRLGVPGQLFSETMYEAGELDIFCRNTLFNIGFCFLPCWTNHFGNIWIQGWTLENTGKSRNRMKTIIANLESLLKETTSVYGVEMLRFLINRYETSICHLDVIDAMNQIRDIGKEPEQVRTALAEASRLVDCYLIKMTEMMPDRGCQGQLVSYAYAMPGYIAHLKKCYLGEDEALVSDDEIETVAPPPAPV